MPISERLDEPYQQSAEPSDPASTVLPITVDGRSYLVDTSRNTPLQERFRRSSVQLLNSQQNIDKGESALTTPEVWRRTYKSWHHGAGQRFADREDSDMHRFDTCKGVNVWERWQVSLLHRTERTSTSPAADGLMANGHTVHLRDDRHYVLITDGKISTTHMLAVSSVIATDGYSVYAYGIDQKIRILTFQNNGTTITVTEYVTPETGLAESVTLLVFANYKLLACTSQGHVWDITGKIGAVSQPLPSAPAYSSPILNQRWVSGCAGKTAIYLMSDTGDKAAIHAFDIVRQSGTGAVDTLIYSGVVAQLPDGELGYALYSYLGYIGIGTSKGFRFAAVNENTKAVTYGPIIETPQPVRCFEGQDRFLYFGMSGVEGESGIGRADLSQFVADLQPAYAPDLMTTGGRASDTVLYINTMADGKMMFGGSGGMFYEQDEYVEEGYLLMSGWTFNVVDQKTGLYVTVQTSTQEGGSGRLDAFYNEQKNPVYLGSPIEPGVSEHRFDLSGRAFSSVALQITMGPDPTALKTPALYSTELRATYIRGAASEWQVPCILHDEYEQDNGTVQGRDVIADFNHLIHLVQTGRQFLYIEEGNQWWVYATDFIWSPQERSVISGWQGVFTIYFREVR